MIAGQGKSEARSSQKSYIHPFCEFQKLIQGVPLKLPHLNFLSTRSHVNWPNKNLSTRGSAPRIAFLHFGLGGDFWKAGGDISVYIKYC